MNYGIGNIKNIDKSKSLFTTTTAPTESGGVITLATTDIVESGFKVGDYLAYVDSDNISALYSISAISNSIATLSLIGNIGGGGGKQLYQHNIWYNDNSNVANASMFCITIITDNNTPFATCGDIDTYLRNKGFDSYLKTHLATGWNNKNSTYYAIIGVYSGNNGLGFALNSYNQFITFNSAANVNDIVTAL